MGQKGRKEIEFAENYIMGKYYSGNYIKHKEVGGTCDTYMGEREVRKGFGGET